jgi:hypothetical protein
LNFSELRRIVAIFPPSIATVSTSFPPARGAAELPAAEAGRRGTQRRRARAKRFMAVSIRTFKVGCRLDAG